jgi:hypothetical protein
VVLAPSRIKIQRGVPKFLYCDNGSEFSGQAMDLWAYQNGVSMAFSRPRKPTDKAFVKSFNGTFRAECLNTHWFTSLTEAQQIVETWRREYNESRPHRALGEKTPNEFVELVQKSRSVHSSRKLTLGLLQKPVRSQKLGHVIPTNAVSMFHALQLKFVSGRIGSYAMQVAGAMVLVNVMRIPCFGRRMTIGRGSIIWPGAN